MKIRIKFTKSGTMIFIGHLDVMRYFQKAIRRADIDIAYSTGFSPHQIMSFASPLGVGLYSKGEYMDIEVNSTPSSAQAVDMLNAVMVDGISVESYKLLPEKAENAMASIAAADYYVTFRDGKNLVGDGWQDKFLAFYNQATIPVLKKTKKGERTVDLKQLIYETSPDGDGMYLRVCADSGNNIKPIQIFEAFFASLGLELPEFALLVTRLDLFTDTRESEAEPHQFVSLNDIGTIIE